MYFTLQTEFRLKEESAAMLAALWAVFRGKC